MSLLLKSNIIIWMNSLLALFTNTIIYKLIIGKVYKYCMSRNLIRNSGTQANRTRYGTCM